MSGGATRTRRRDQAQTVEVPALSPEGLKGTLDILEEMSFMFPTPVKELNTSAFRLFQIVDSVSDPISFSVVQDSLRIRRFVILFKESQEVAIVWRWTLLLLQMFMGTQPI
jgi:hypothetical protein